MGGREARGLRAARAGGRAPTGPPPRPAPRLRTAPGRPSDRSVRWSTARPPTRRGDPGATWPTTGTTLSRRTDVRRKRYGSGRTGIHRVVHVGGRARAHRRLRRPGHGSARACSGTPPRSRTRPSSPCPPTSARSTRSARPNPRARPPPSPSPTPPRPRLLGAPVPVRGGAPTHLAVHQGHLLTANYSAPGSVTVLALDGRRRARRGPLRAGARGRRPEPGAPGGPARPRRAARPHRPLGGQRRPGHGLGAGLRTRRGRAASWRSSANSACAPASARATSTFHPDGRPRLRDERARLRRHRLPLGRRQGQPAAARRGPGAARGRRGRELPLGAGRLARRPVRLGRQPRPQQHRRAQRGRDRRAARTARHRRLRRRLAAPPHPRPLRAPGSTRPTSARATSPGSTSTRPPASRSRRARWSCPRSPACSSAERRGAGRCPAAQWRSGTEPGGPRGARPPPCPSRVPRYCCGPARLRRLRARCPARRRTA